MKKIFVIDWILLVVAALSAYSGIELHVAGHGDVHEIWHNWAVVHVITSLLFLIFGVVHVKMHWGWYKSLFAKGIGNKSRVTLLLSVIFSVVVLTGVVLLAFVDGANSGMGLCFKQTKTLTGLSAPPGFRQVTRFRADYSAAGITLTLRWVLMN